MKKGVVVLVIIATVIAIVLVSQFDVTGDAIRLKKKIKTQSPKLEAGENEHRLIGCYSEFSLKKCISYTWNLTFSNPSNDLGEAVAIDNKLNIIAVGTTQLGDFGSPYKGLIVKYNQSGYQLWNRTYTLYGKSTDQLYDVIVDRYDNIYAVGRAEKSSGNFDIWIIKTDRDGNLLWQKNHSSIYMDEGHGIVFNNTYGNEYPIEVEGTYNPVIAARNDKEILTAKYNRSNGALLWKSNFKRGKQVDYGRGITVDVEGNLYVVGEFNKFASGFGDHDIVLLKYDNTGYLVWNKTYGGNADDFSSDITSYQVPSYNGSIAITGYTRSFGVQNSEVGQYNAWTFVVDTDGEMIWNSTVGGVKDDRGQGIVYDYDKNLFVAGYTYSFSSDGSQDAWFLVYDYAGNLVLNKTFGGPNYDVAEEIESDKHFQITERPESQGNIVLVGHTQPNSSSGRDLWIINLYKNESYDF